MKPYIRSFFLFSLLVTTIISSCEDGDKIFDEIITTTTRGAVLRTINLISNELPIGVADAGFAVELEVQDIESGDLLDNLDVYIGFRDNTVEDGDPDLDVPEALFRNIPASEFATGEFGLPRTTFEVSLDEMLSFTGVDEADLFGGDQFEVRFVLNLTDGRSFSNDDNSGTLTGSFFSSPFLYTPTVVCPINDDQFIGDYVLESVAPGVFGDPVFFPDGTTVELTFGETSTQRTFEAIYLDAIGQDPMEFTFDLVCGNVIPTSDQGTGLGCSGTLALGPPEDMVYGTYDVADDSSFLVIVTDNTQSDCGGGPVIASFRLSKE